jgi:hypothetical protein
MAETLIMVGSWHILNCFCPDFSPFSAMMDTFRAAREGQPGGGRSGTGLSHASILLC